VPSMSLDRKTFMTAPFPDRARSPARARQAPSEHGLLF